MPKPIPDRWTAYNACGKVIEGTRFICFKVPLSRNVQSNVREINKIWDIPTVLEDIPKLGAVIDLTNTARYYNPADFLRANILHRKILMPGRIIPPESSVKEFMDAVDEFLAKDNDSFIGVHCTHGLNRTGYMVCRYMRDKLGIPAQEAIAKFEAARGYKMERDVYIKSILGNSSIQPSNIGEIEVVPVKNVEKKYISSQHGNRDTAYTQQYGNKSSYNNTYKDRNRFSNKPSPSTNNGLFSCYTNRYSNMHDSSGSRDNKNARPYAPVWNNRDERNGNRNKIVDISGYNRNSHGYNDNSAFDTNGYNGDRNVRSGYNDNRSVGSSRYNDNGTDDSNRYNRNAVNSSGYNGNRFADGSAYNGNNTVNSRYNGDRTFYNNGFNGSRTFNSNGYNGNRTNDNSGYHRYNPWL